MSVLTGQGAELRHGEVASYVSDRLDRDDGEGMAKRLSGEIVPADRERRAQGGWHPAARSRSRPRTGRRSEGVARQSV